MTAGSHFLSNSFRISRERRVCVTGTVGLSAPLCSLCLEQMEPWLASNIEKHRTGLQSALTSPLEIMSSWTD